jgi:nucleoside-diphosphate-sugar epimerase
MAITILGAGGWVGSALSDYLCQLGHEVKRIDRTNLSFWLEASDLHGPIIYAIGLTADFRQRPHETCRAHVDLISQVLQRKGIDQLVYLSSTRVYSRSADTSESAALPCLSSDPSDLYNLSKLLGEALVLQDPRPGMRVVRLSNVVGPGQPRSTFIGALLAEAKATNSVTIRQPASAEKDYVALVDVVRLLPEIAQHAQKRLYNLGSGFNSSHSEVANWLERQGIEVKFSNSPEGCPSFPPIQIERLCEEFVPPGHPFRQNLL